MNVTDIILYQWLSFPEYLHKKVQIYAYKVIGIETTPLVKISHINMIMKNSFSVIMSCYARYLLKYVLKSDIKL